MSSNNSVARIPPLTLRAFYGWRIVAAVFLNLFFAVGIVYYGLPVFYPPLVDALHFTRAEVTKGIFYGFAIVAPVFGLLAGVAIDRFGARDVVRVGVLFVGASFIFLGSVHTLHQYYFFCFTEVFGYVLAGPIPNQVLIANWFSRQRGRAMGYAYLGLGLGGVVAPILVHALIQNFGWRHAFQVLGAVILIVLVPIAFFVTRSAPAEMGLLPDGEPTDIAKQSADLSTRAGVAVANALRTWNFWLLLAGSTLVIFTIGTVISHFILYLTDQQYSPAAASTALSALLVSSLAGRIIVGYFADRFTRKNLMALFYLLLGLAVPLLVFVRHTPALWSFAAVFGFAMGADYMLIPLVAADCFGLKALGRLLAIIIMADSLGQTYGPVMAGRIYDHTRSYSPAWAIVTIAAVFGAAAIYLIKMRAPGHASGGPVAVQIE